MAPEPSRDFERLLAQAGSAAAERLTAAGVAPAGLGSYIPPRRRLLGTRPERIQRIGSAWALGALLVTDEGTLLAAGQTLRAHTPKPHICYTSESAQRRDLLRLAAVRGGFREGETVHWDARELTETELSPSSVPVCVRDGMLAVRWALTAPATSARPITEYLTSRIELLLNDPAC